MVVLTKLAQFQQAGHTVVLIIGDFTARVGDPSGRDTTRPVLTPEEIEANAQTYQDQAFKVLDRERTEVRRNGEWLDMPAQELFALLGKTTVARLLEREDFTKRMKADRPISSLELSIPSCRVTTPSPSGRTSSWGGPTRSSTCSSPGTSSGPTTCPSSRS